MRKLTRKYLSAAPGSFDSNLTNPSSYREFTSGPLENQCPNLRLEPGADEKAVLIAVDRILEPYGGLGAYGRDLQVSSSILDGEIAQIEAMVLFLPAVFLAVAAFLRELVWAILYLIPGWRNKARAQLHNNLETLILCFRLK